MSTQNPKAARVAINAAPGMTNGTTKAAPAATGAKRAVGTSRPRASLVDVATLAGVSSGTVSRALTRPDMISQATRERVLAAAQRLGYVANGAARALVMRRSMTVGALVPRFGGSSFPTMIQALESTLAAADYTLLLSAPEHSRGQGPAALAALLERGVDAVALLGAQHPPQVFAALTAHQRPFVMMWAQHSPQGVCVGFDEGEAASLLVDHLAALGHREIGFVGGRTEHNERARRRLLGLTLAIARHGIRLAPQAMLEVDYGFAQGFEAMTELLQRGLTITAVVCGNDYLATGALAALAQAGVPVPGQLSVASFNDNDFAAYLYPPLTTVRLPIREMGEQAGHYLLQRLRGAQPQHQALLPVELIVRQSTGYAPRAQE
ncbi:MAG: LacI family DNA-binding transcriptional regulator [Proteobacteria bacterium]|nr:LacI family DNA-binding transcriptional regulator [Pseudomonadota bacterium]